MTKPIGILYEHPEWFAPLFAELDSRGVLYVGIPAHEHHFDPDERSAPYSLLVNRVSPSAYLRGHTSAIFHAQQYLAQLESIGVPVVNGTQAFALETSKARQLSLLAGLDLPHPVSRVVNALDQIVPAAAAVGYPVIVKPNIGGSGALMRRFDHPDELRQALANRELDGILGLDYTAIVQQFHRPAGGSIVRVEALDDRYLYAIRISSDPDQGFNLCPADICQVPGEAGEPIAQLEDFDACPVDVSAKQERRIERADPPGWVIDAVLRIFREARIDVGGVEYLESERDGQLYLYDVNALSNFVTDAPRLVGFDPFVQLVDFFERRAGIAPGWPVGAGRNGRVN